MGIGVVMMVVVVVVVVTVVMGMIMMVMIVPVAVMVMVMPGLAGADALHVVVVALLCQADLRLEAEHLRAVLAELAVHQRSEEHTSELQSLMRISYAVFCLKK